MNPADRPHFHGRLRPMDTQPPAGRAPDISPRPARARILTAIPLAMFWLVMAVLCLIRLFGNFS